MIGARFFLWRLSSYLHSFKTIWCFLLTLKYLYPKLFLKKFLNIFYMFIACLILLVIKRKWMIKAWIFRYFNEIVPIMYMNFTQGLNGKYSNHNFSSYASKIQPKKFLKYFLVLNSCKPRFLVKQILRRIN